jgi:hypothetical protein
MIYKVWAHIPLMFMYNVFDNSIYIYIFIILWWYRRYTGILYVTWKFSDIATLFILVKIVKSLETETTRYNHARHIYI